MTTDARRTSKSDRELTRATWRLVGPPAVLLAALQLSFDIAGPRSPSGLVETAWALAPVLPGLWLVWAYSRSLSRADEYQRRVQFEAAGIGFVVTILLAGFGGVLDAAGIGDPRQSLQVTFIGGVAAWAVALTIKTARGG
jgi:hypothetical protein